MSLQTLIENNNLNLDYLDIRVNNLTCDEALEINGVPVSFDISTDTLNGNAQIDNHDPVPITIELRRFGNTVMIEIPSFSVTNTTGVAGDLITLPNVLLDYQPNDPIDNIPVFYETAGNKIKAYCSVSVSLTINNVAKALGTLLPGDTYTFDKCTLIYNKNNN